MSSRITHLVNHLRTILYSIGRCKREQVCPRNSVKLSHLIALIPTKRTHRSPEHIHPCNIYHDRSSFPFCIFLTALFR